MHRLAQAVGAGRQHEAAPAPGHRGDAGQRGVAAGAGTPGSGAAAWRRPAALRSAVRRASAPSRASGRSRSASSRESCLALALVSRTRPPAAVQAGGPYQAREQVQRPATEYRIDAAGKAGMRARNRPLQPVRRPGVRKRPQRETASTRQPASPRRSSSGAPIRPLAPNTSAVYRRPPRAGEVARVDQQVQADAGGIAQRDRPAPT